MQAFGRPAKRAHHSGFGTDRPGRAAVGDPVILQCYIYPRIGGERRVWAGYSRVIEALRYFSCWFLDPDRRASVDLVPAHGEKELNKGRREHQRLGAVCLHFCITESPACSPPRSTGLRCAHCNCAHGEWGTKISMAAARTHRSSSENTTILRSYVQR